MLALPEAFITGYQTQDLIMRPAFWTEAMEAVETLAAQCSDGPVIGIGAPYHDGKDLYNAYWILGGGKVLTRILKQLLPNETVFDEVRQFTAAPPQTPYQIGPLRIGSPVCEDAWWPDAVSADLAKKGAEILLVPNGSPYYRGKMAVRHGVIRGRVEETGLATVYLNMVGGQDDQAFEGGSFAMSVDGEIVRQLPQFDEVIAQLDFERGAQGWDIIPGDVVPVLDDYEADYRAMVETLRDYMGKTGFQKVLLGMSGGIDSAIVATIAADALGPENVRCVMLPSEYTSQGSLEDAKDCASRLGCRYDFVPISEGRGAITNTLAPLFEGTKEGIAEENIQSRLRGLLLMALSNKFGEMLLTTGNKSEVAVGYATIYGDMAGGFAIIKDIPKTMVYRLSKYFNKSAKKDIIPTAIITKEPSAELRPDQKDTDSLPPYEELDRILKLYIEDDLGIKEIIKAGENKELTERIVRMVDKNEYKRRQSPPGIKITTKAFGKDRRMPITNRYK